MQNVSLHNSIIASLEKIVLKSYSVAKKVHRMVMDNLKWNWGFPEFLNFQ